MLFEQCIWKRHHAQILPGSCHHLIFLPRLQRTLWTQVAETAFLVLLTTCRLVEPRARATLASAVQRRTNIRKLDCVVQTIIAVSIAALDRCHNLSLCATAVVLPSTACFI